MSNEWMLPTSDRQEGESMRAAADRAVSQFCGPNLNVQILGNAPWAFYKNRYSKAYRNSSGYMGQKVSIHIVCPKES